MPCYKPVKAFYGNLLPSGKREIVFSSGQAQSCIDLKLPCGTCVGCRLERARQWAMRCMDEASLHRHNSFITLTFNDKNLPLNRSLDVSVFQKFMKRLRKEVAPLRLRFFIVANTVLVSVVHTIIRLFLGMISLINSSLRSQKLKKRYISRLSLIALGALVMLLSARLRSVRRRMSRDIISKKLALSSLTITIRTDVRASYLRLNMSR